MYFKRQFNQRKAIRFRQFSRKGYALFACLGRVVTIGVLSVATLRAAAVTTPDSLSVVGGSSANIADDDSPDKEATLDDVEVTGSRAPLALGQAARMVTVLSREEIQAAPVQSINDLLKMAVGVDVRQRGPLGAQTDVGIRGSTQEQITILLNGINICDPQTGHNAMDLPVDLSDIVRIEVLEGPAGRIYGSSSLVGAINIVTSSRSEKNAHSLQMHAEGGSYGYAKLGGRFGFEKSSFSNTVSANYARSDGYSRSKAGSLNTDFSGAKGFCQGQYMDEDVRIRWHLGIADKGFGSSTFWASPKWQADDQYEHTTKIYSAIQAETHCGRLKLMPSIYWNQNNDRYEGYRDQPEKMKYNYNRTDVYGVNLSSYFDWVAGRTAFGAEIRNEDLVSGNLGEPLAQTHHIKGTDRDYTLGVNRTNISGYLEHNLLLERLTISAGFVAVKNTWSNMNMTIYPGIDASYRPNNHWTIHASYNTSLRMPSFTEMYYKLQGYAADPHLKPEEMRALEAGFNFQFSIFNLQCALWHHSGRNMIDWIMDTSKGDEAVWQSVNHTKINSIGFEADARLRLKNTELRVSYSYINQDKEQEAGIVSQYALEYLRHKLVAYALFPLWKQLTLGVNFRWQDRVGQYTDFDGVVHDYQPYALVDTRLTWAEPKWKVYVEANNLFDKDYVDFGHVEEPGRWLIAGFAFSL